VLRLFTSLTPRRRARPHTYTRTRLTLERLEERIALSDVSPPTILQFFEGSYQTIENRMPDIFNAGYGQLLTPPPGRADSGNQSVGYDVYNRFYLGGPGNPTLYGTETGLKALVTAVHQMGGKYYSDLVWNHDGFSDWNSVDGQGHSFVNAGGYPGFVLQTSTNPYGDFHNPNDTSLTGMRLAGLIDIAQESNNQYIRNPVDPNDPLNLPAGTTAAFGRLANVADSNNARFYPDQSLQPISVYDPKTGEQNIKIYPFNNTSPLDGTPVAENALGYLMRYAQWMVQYVGVDGFRIDAAKNMPSWVLNYLDRAVYRSSFRTALNGSQEQVFSFGEVFDSSKSFIQQFIRKDINPNDPGTIGGNRDALDFPLYFALDGNLTSNGLQNSWFNVVDAGLDSQNHGSQGVAFVSSADSPAPYLENVAYAYTLMRPGNAIVYFNAHQFGDSSARSFPRDGRGDALGGLYGNILTTLVNIRDTHPGGNYVQRDLEKETLIFERQDSELVALSNRLDGGYDSRTVQTSFAPGTPLIELTGNATDPNADPDGAIPPLLVVNQNGTVNLRVPRNRNDNGTETDKGYVIYAPSGPQVSLQLSNVDHVIAGQTPTASTNGTARLSSIPVITGNSFQIELDTNKVNLLGSYRDQDADGDNALFKIDDGTDVTGNGFVSTNPDDVAYGFQQFTTTHSPGYFNANGNGKYVQTIDVSKLSNGLHYITVRAFRHRNSSEPPIFTDFRETIYVDRQVPVSSLVNFDPIVAGVNENRRVTVKSTDQRAQSVYVFLDLPASLTDAQVAAMIGAGNKATQTDRDLFTKDFSGVTSGNHVITVVTFDLAGKYNVQRFPGQFTSTIYGAGLGDVNFDGQITADDVVQFGQILASNNTKFNAAADLNGDGRIDNADLLLLWNRLQEVGADDATLAAYNNLLGLPADGFTIRAGDPVTLTATRPTGNTPALSFGWDLTGNGQFTDASGATATLTWSQLVGLGISDEGTYPIALQVTDGTTPVTFTTNLTVTHRSPLVVVSTATAGALSNVSTTFTALASFRHGIDGGAALPLSSYSATIDWNDGSSVESSAGTTVTITLDATGTTILVSGTHTYATGQVYSPTVTLSTDEESVSATPTIHVATDVSNSASFQKSSLTYNSTSQVYEGTLTVTNTGTTGIDGTLLILLQNLTSGVTLTGATVAVGGTTYTLTVTTSLAGYPVIAIPRSVVTSLAKGQSLTVALRFRDPLADAIDYTPLLFSDPWNG
jgi:glycosidase